MRAFLVVIAVAAFGLAACGDRKQIAEGKRSYQGKPDTRPWENALLSYDEAKWTKGDRASWETEIKARQLTQHEYKRIEQ